MFDDSKLTDTQKCKANQVKINKFGFYDKLTSIGNLQL